VAYVRIVSSFDNVLVGVDGRSGGRDAIALATLLAAPSTNLTLAHVDAAGSVSWWAHHVGDERVFDRSALMLAAERDRAAVQAAIVCAGGNPPARGLHDLAAERAADLVVVGSSRHGRLGRVLLGDDARDTLDWAPCAVAIAPHGYAEGSPPLAEIGVGIDGSAEGEHALATARELASRVGAGIRTVWVVSSQDVRELSRFSGELGLLIVCSRVTAAVGRPAHGSVAQYLAGHAACPLLVLPPASVGAGSGYYGPKRPASPDAVARPAA
jgi:nucleotide-binding universal stress UspA family protein